MKISSFPNSVWVPVNVIKSMVSEISRMHLSSSKIAKKQDWDGERGN